MLCTLRGRILQPFLPEVLFNARPHTIGAVAPPCPLVHSAKTRNHVRGSHKITIDCWTSRLNGLKTTPGDCFVSNGKSVLTGVSRSLKKSPPVLPSMACGPKSLAWIQMRTFTIGASLSAGAIRPGLSVTPSSVITMSRETPGKAVASIVGGNTSSTSRRFLSTHPTRPRSQQKNGNGNGSGHEHRYDETFLNEDPTLALKKSLAAVPQYASKNEMKLRVTELDVHGNIKMTAGEFLKTDLCQQVSRVPESMYSFYYCCFVHVTFTHFREAHSHSQMISFFFSTLSMVYIPETCERLTGDSVNKFLWFWYDLKSSLSTWETFEP